MDEKGVLIGITSGSKRAFSREAWEGKEVRDAIQDGSRSWITVLACVCADGAALPPGIVYESNSNTIQSSWVDEVQSRQHSAFFTSSPTGWSNNEIGVAWLQQVFDRSTKPKARSSWRLLILDGHRSHVSMDFISYCDQNKILLAISPPPPHIQLTAFNPWMLCCSSPFPPSTPRSSQPISRIARGYFQSRKETSFTSSGTPGAPPLEKRASRRPLK
jgi:hypothetical protein